MNTSLMGGGAPLLCGASPGCRGYLRPPPLPLAPMASTVRVVPAWAGLGGQSHPEATLRLQLGARPRDGDCAPASTSSKFMVTLRRVSGSPMFGLCLPAPLG